MEDHHKDIKNINKLGPTLLRVQVKGFSGNPVANFRDRDRGGQGIDHTHKTNKGKRIGRKDCDLYVAVDKQFGICYIIPVKDIDNVADKDHFNEIELQKYKEKWQNIEKNCKGNRGKLKMRLKVHKSSAKKVITRLKNRVRIRKKIEGDEVRPRLAVFRSNKHIYAQIIDDQQKKTLLAVSSLKESKNNKEVASVIGEKIAKQALEKSITAVKFDRSGYVYHGRIKALADAARSAGLNF